MAPDSSAGPLLCRVPPRPHSAGWTPCQGCPPSIPPRCASPSPSPPVTVSGRGSRPPCEATLVAATVATPRHGSQMSPAKGLQGCPALAEAPAPPCRAAAALHQPEPQARCPQLVGAQEGVLPTARAPGRVGKPNHSCLKEGHWHYRTLLLPSAIAR